MGRIKTKGVKRVTNELVESHFEEFSDNFDDNKPVVNKYIEVGSVKLRNVITGYVTRRVKSKEKI